MRRRAARLLAQPVPVGAEVEGMETYQNTPTTKHRLIPGLHVAIVTTPQKGLGGTMFAVETYIAAKLSGLPAILATFDPEHRYPDIGPDLRRLPDGETCLSGIESLGSLLPLIREAEKGHKILIIDSKSGFSVQHPFLEILEYCGIHQATSIAALISSRQDLPGFHDEAAACREFQSAKISFARGLVRAWGRPVHGAALELPDIPLIACWTPRILSPRALSLIQSAPQPPPQHPDLFSDLAESTQSNRPLKPSSEVRLHLSSATSAIHAAILAPICLPLPR